MKLLSSHIAAPAFLAALSYLAACSSGTPPAATPAARPRAAQPPLGPRVRQARLVRAPVAAREVRAAQVAPVQAPQESAAGAGAAAQPAEAPPWKHRSTRSKRSIRLTPCTGAGCHGEEGTPMHWGPDGPQAL